MNLSQAQQNRAIRAVAKAVVECLDAQGTPSGTVYAALMTQGCALRQYESLLAGLVKVGAVEQHGQLLFPGPSAALVTGGK